MYRKKIVAYGSIASLEEFLNSPFNRTYKILAIMTDENVNATSVRMGGGDGN